jgi:transposase
VDLTDEQWAVLEPLIPEPPCRPDRRGRLWRDAREVLDGVLWVLRMALPGATYRGATHPTRPAIGASRRECVMAPSSGYSRPSPST